MFHFNGEQYTCQKHHQFLTATWRRWVQTNDHHCPLSFFKSVAPRSVQVCFVIIDIVHPA